MKAICASLILALLVTSTMSAGSCDNANKGFPIYAEAAAAGTASANAGVTPTAAGATATTCTEIWTPDGTCCVTAQLNTLFSAKMTPIKTAWDAFVAGAVAVNGTLAKLKAMVANSTNVTSDLTAAYNATNTSAAQFEGLSVDQAVNLSMTINMFATAVADFKNTSVACFDALVNYRGAAFCYGCSAKATHMAFFGTTSGALTISTATRDAIALKCVKPWGFIYNLGSAMQVLAILNKQRSVNATAAVRPTAVAFSGVTGAQLYEAFMACPNSTVTAVCTQGLIDRIVVAHFSLFAPEMYANGNNLVAGTSSSQARRILADATATGLVVIASDATSGADLTVNLTRPTYTGTVAVSTLPDAPAAAGSGSGTGSGTGSGSGSGSGTTTSAGNIFAMTAIATLAAFVLTLN